MQKYNSRHRKVYEKSTVLGRPRPLVPLAPPPTPPILPKPARHIFTPLPECSVVPTPMRSLPESVDISLARVVSRTPSSSSLVSGVIVPKPKPASVPEVIRVVPEPEPIPEPELPVGSRAWKIANFVKRHFKN